MALDKTQLRKLKSKIKSFHSVIDDLNDEHEGILDNLLNEIEDVLAEISERLDDIGEAFVGGEDLDD